MLPNRQSRRDFLRTGGVGLLGAVAFRGGTLTLERIRELNLYVGTYTSGKSEGIYVYRMNLETGELTRSNSIKAVNPSFLTINGGRPLPRDCRSHQTVCVRRKLYRWKRLGLSYSA